MSLMQANYISKLFLFLFSGRIAGAVSDVADVFSGGEDSGGLDFSCE